MFVCVLPSSPVQSLSSGARSVLSAFYLSLRRRGGGSAPVTTRQLEALIRLAEARAKADLKEIVTLEHAQDVVNLMRESMSDVEESGGLVVEPGGSTSSRPNPRGGMSKAALKKKFVSILRRKSEVKMESTFTAAELYTIHEEANMRNQIDDFGAFIESLNTENYLLVRKRQRIHTGMGGWVRCFPHWVRHLILKRSFLRVFVYAYVCEENRPETLQTDDRLVLILPPDTSNTHSTRAQDWKT